MSRALPQGDEKAQRVRGMFDAIAGRYDLVNRVMTFGMDVGWRRRAVRELRLPGGALVGDLACGTGDLCRELTRAGYRAIGFDFSLGMLANATTPVPLVAADLGERGLHEVGQAHDPARTASRPDAGGHTGAGHPHRRAFEEEAARLIVREEVERRTESFRPRD